MILILINGFFSLFFLAYAHGCHCDRLGIQIAQLAIIGTQLSMVLLSIVLLIGIHKVSFLYNIIAAASIHLIQLILIEMCLFPFNSFFHSLLFPIFRLTTGWWGKCNFIKYRKTPILLYHTLLDF